MAGGIALHNGLQIRRHALHHARVTAQDGAEERLQVIPPHIPAGELARQAHRHGIGERMAAEHHIIQQPVHLRLLLHGLLGGGVNILPHALRHTGAAGFHVFRA